MSDLEICPWQHRRSRDQTLRNICFEFLTKPLTVTPPFRQKIAKRRGHVSRNVESGFLEMFMLARKFDLQHLSHSNRRWAESDIRDV